MTCQNILNSQLENLYNEFLSIVTCARDQEQCINSIKEIIQKAESIQVQQHLNNNAITDNLIYVQDEMDPSCTQYYTGFKFTDKDNFEGVGTLTTYQNGTKASMFQGQVKNYLPNGYGYFQKFQDNTYQKGIFQNGKQTGTGQSSIFAPHLNQYVLLQGEYTDGKLHGVGMLSLVNNPQIYVNCQVENGIIQQIINFQGNFNTFFIEKNVKHSYLFTKFIKTKLYHNKLLPEFQYIQDNQIILSNQLQSDSNDKFGTFQPLKLQNKKISKGLNQQNNTNYTIKYGSSTGERLFKLKLKQKNSQNNTFTCSVCQSDIQENQKLITFPCKGKHLYHSECLRQWIEKKPNCPDCRTDLRGLIKISTLISEQGQLSFTIPIENIELYKGELQEMYEENTYNENTKISAFIQQDKQEEKQQNQQYPYLNNIMKQKSQDC